MTVTQGAHLTARGTEPRVLVPGLASRGARHAVYGIGLFSALINVLALTGSLFMLQVYDRVLPSHSVPTLVALALLTAALFAFYGLLDLFRGRMLVRLGAWLDAAISPQVYQAIVHLPLARLPEQQGGAAARPRYRALVLVGTGPLRAVRSALGALLSRRHLPVPPAAHPAGSGRNARAGPGDAGHRPVHQGSHPRGQRACR